MSKTLSIITVCYNSEKTIEGCIQSVLSQSYSSIDYIIVDGGSTDNTISIINKYSDRIRYISEKDKGIYDAMNKGINMAIGDVIGILNSDDELLDSNVCGTIMKTFENKNVDIVYGDLLMYKHFEDAKPARIWKAGIQKSFLLGWHPPHPSTYIKKEAYNKFGLYKIEKKISADFDLMLRLFQVHKLKAAYVKIPFVKMRMGGVSTKNVKGIFNGNKDIRDSFKENKLKYYWFYPLVRFTKKGLQYLPK